MPAPHAPGKFVLRMHGVQRPRSYRFGEFAYECLCPTGRRDAVGGDRCASWRVAGIFVRKYTLRRYSFFFKEIEVKSIEFSTPC